MTPDPAQGRSSDDDPFGFDERGRDEPRQESADLGMERSPRIDAGSEEAIREAEPAASANDPAAAIQPAAAARAAAELGESMAGLSRSIVGLWGRVEAAERAMASLEARLGSIEVWARETRNLSRRAAGALHDLEHSQSER
jgi:hypothetical protein